MDGLARVENACWRSNFAIYAPLLAVTCSLAASSTLQTDNEKSLMSTPSLTLLPFVRLKFIIMRYSSLNFGLLTSELVRKTGKGDSQNGPTECLRATSLKMDWYKISENWRADWDSGREAGLWGPRWPMFAPYKIYAKFFRQRMSQGGLSDRHWKRRNKVVTINSGNGASLFIRADFCLVIFPAYETPLTSKMFARPSRYESPKTPFSTDFRFDSPVSLGASWKKNAD